MSTSNPPQNHSGGPRLGKRALTLAFLALGVGGFSIGTVEFAMMGLLKEIEKGIGISTPEAGTLISAYALGVCVGAPLLASFGAKLPRKYLAIGLMVFYALANASSIFAASYGSMFLSRFIAGLPHGAYFGVAAVIAASLVAANRRGWAISMVMTGLTVANVIGVPLSTLLGQHFGFQVLFIITAIIAALCAVAIALFIPYEAPHPEASIRRELGALKRVQVWMALFTGMIGFGGMFATYTYISHTMTSVAGLPELLMPVVVAIYGVGMVVGTLIGGRLADKSVMGSIYRAMIAMAAALVIYALAVHWAPTALLMVFVVGAIGSLLTAPLQTRLLDASPDAPSLASSLNHAALNIGNALGAALGGVVIAMGLGYTAPALVGAVLAILGLGIALTSGRLEKRFPVPPVDA